MSFFDKINNRMIANAVKQVFNRRNREILFTNVPQFGAFH